MANYLFESTSVGDQINQLLLDVRRNGVATVRDAQQGDFVVIRDKAYAALIRASGKEAEPAVEKSEEERVLDDYQRREQEGYGIGG